MSYEQLIALAIANEDNRRDLLVDAWDEPDLEFSPKQLQPKPEVYQVSDV